MSGRQPRLTRAEQQARTRAHLLAAAGEVIAEHGLEAAAIDDIAARAGYSRGAFYSNFPDKLALLIALSDARLAAFADSTLPQLLTGSPEEQLAAVARWLSAERPPLEVLLLVELARQRLRSPERAAELSAAIDRVLAAVEQLLVTHDPHGVEVPATERAAQARAALAAVLGADLLRHLGVGADARTLELLLAGIDGGVARAEVTPSSLPGATAAAEHGAHHPPEAP